MKNFFNNLGVKFQRFMYGRYGVDELYRGLFWIYLSTILLGVILGSTIDRRISSIVSILGLGIIIFAFYRVFSKNYEKRRMENQKWLVFENKIKKEFRLIKDKWKFRKTHIFRKCPKCKAVLRLKKQKGKHNVKCPHCQTNFEVKVL